MKCLISLKIIPNGKDRFIEYIERHLKASQEIIDTTNNMNKKKMHLNSHKMNEIKVQNRIWRLLAYLLKSKSNNNNNNAANNNFDDDIYYFNPSVFIRDECNNDYNLRKLDNIILWLQDIATTPSFLEKGDICYSRTINDNSSLNISLDPDNILNGKNNDMIDINDINYEDRLLMNVFYLIRKGLYNKAIELCRNYGCFWRAASLNGKVLFNDKNNTENKIDAVIGNEEYLMWLRTCNVICKNSKIGPEKWIYSTLCGNVEQLITFINNPNNSNNNNNKGNWYDLLWILLICKKTYKQYQLLCNQLPSFYHNDLKNNKLNENNSIFSKLDVINKIE